MTSEAKTTAGEIVLFKYDPIANGSDTFNIDKALNENWDKITGEFVRQAQEDTQLSEQVRTLGEQVEGLDVSWEGVGGKPDTFPPTQHGHSINEVNGLQEELNKKAPTHSHPYASTATATQGANGLQSASDKKKLDGIATGANNYVHPSGTNPHKTTKADVGLGNVPNYGATSSVSDSSNAKFATAGAVRTAYNKGVEALNKANEALNGSTVKLVQRGLLSPSVSPNNTVPSHGSENGIPYMDITISPVNTAKSIINAYATAPIGLSKATTLSARILASNKIRIYSTYYHSTSTGVWCNVSWEVIEFN